MSKISNFMISKPKAPQYPWYEQHVHPQRLRHPIPTYTGYVIPSTTNEAIWKSSKSRGNKFSEVAVYINIGTQIL